MRLKLDDSNISYALLKREQSTEAVYETLISHNLDRYYHPASLLKLFTGVMFEENVLDYASVEYKAKYEQALLASIYDSDNDALAFIIDLLAPYSADYNFQSKDALLEIVSARKQINDFFKSRGFSSEINLANKCFGFDYYGKEEQLLEKLGPNKINCQDLIDLLIMIETSYVKVFKAMRRELFVDEASAREIPSSIINTQDYQIEAFAGKVLAEKLKVKEIYSKAAWTSKVRHDAVVFDSVSLSETQFSESAPQARYMLTVMTEGYSHDPGVLQGVVESLLGEGKITVF